MSRLAKLVSALLIAALTVTPMAAVGESPEEVSVTPEEGAAIEWIDPSAIPETDEAEEEEVVAEAADAPVAERPAFELGGPDEEIEIVAMANAATVLAFCADDAVLRVGEALSVWQLFRPEDPLAELTLDDVEVCIEDTDVVCLDGEGGLLALAEGATRVRVTLPQGASAEGVVTVVADAGPVAQYIGGTPEKLYDGTDEFRLDPSDFLLDEATLASGMAVEDIEAVSDGADAGPHRLTVVLTVSDEEGWRQQTSLTLDAAIMPMPLSELDGAGDILAAGTALDYTGAPVCPEITPPSLGGAQLREGVDYTLEYENNLAAGTATVALKGIGNFTGSCSADFEILPVDIVQSGVAAALDALRGADYMWNGAPVCPDFTLSFNGAELTRDVDYTVTFSGNEAPGVAMMTVSGAGSFTGSLDIPFIILDRLLAAPESVIPETLELGVGETYQLALSDSGAAFASSNKKIAAVSAMGVIKGVKKGRASIGVHTSDGKTYIVAVTVKAAPTKVALSAKKLTLYVGQTQALTAKLSPSGCRRNITWASSNEGVARVVNGSIVALKPGKAVVAVRTYNKKTAKCTVTVVAAPESVSLNRTEASMFTKGTLTLKASVSPAGAYSSVRFSSSNSAIATVNSKGKVTAKKPGEVTITVETANGRTAKCKITVIKAPSKVIISRKSATLAATMTLQLTASTDTETNPTLSWSSSNKKVATVSATGLVTAKKAGTATITAKTANGKKASCKVTVKALPKSVTVKAAKTTLEVGETTKAAATLTKKSYSPIEWSVEGDAVTVDQSGNIKAVKPGTATVLATATAAYIAGSVKITVRGDASDSGDQGGGSQAQTGGKLIIDISKWNGSINFDKVKPNVSLVICRASCATSIDVKFESYAKDMNARGIPFGVYCYSHASDAASAQQEARYFYACAAKYKPKFYVLDAEEASLNQEAILAFVSTLRSLGANKVGIYVAHHRYNQYGMSSIKGRFDFVWIPRYGKNDGTVGSATKPAYPCDMWQYSSKGKVAGISGDVDVNVLTGQGKGLSWFVS